MCSWSNPPIDWILFHWIRMNRIEKWTAAVREKNANCFRLSSNAYASIFIPIAKNTNESIMSGDNCWAITFIVSPDHWSMLYIWHPIRWATISCRYAFDFFATGLHILYESSDRSNDMHIGKKSNVGKNAYTYVLAILWWILKRISETASTSKTNLETIEDKCI